MKKILFATLLVVFMAAQVASAHDPREAAKTFSHTLTIDGAGKLTLSYKSLHWNEGAYATLKKNEVQRNRVVGSLWKNIGKLDTEFDVVISGVKVPKGSYNFGLWFGDKDDFKIVLAGGGQDLKIDLTTANDGALVDFLTFDLRPTDTNKPDMYLIEGRSGKFRCSASVQVPYLAGHDHPAEKKN